MKTILNVLDKRRPIFIWWLSVLIVLISCISITILEGLFDLTPILVIPVLLVSWYGNSKAGFGLAVLSSIFLYFTGILTVYTEYDSALSVYDALAILVVNICVATLVTNFRKVHGVEVIAADTDTLTGVHSSRSFYAEIANEILRSNRYGRVFSLVYIDVDNFKNINDSFGHTEGDRLLVELSKCLEKSFRTTDTIARIGGDEFVCLLPETTQNEAKNAYLNAETILKKAMKKNNWDVSFSVGVVTFDTLPENVHDAVKLADELMYTVKNNRKNDVAYKVWSGSA